ncbi:hypothetical protein CCMA1212_005602 [Trichoderma ghanense]|uniref:Uncharacterized protein n=1 Tax=Trichoderma ghanense TaxID=65468 RepID=A0ABY2H452_9HYPO
MSCSLCKSIPLVRDMEHDTAANKQFPCQEHVASGASSSILPSSRLSRPFHVIAVRTCGGLPLPTAIFYSVA